MKRRNIVVCKIIDSPQKNTKNFIFSIYFDFKATATISMEIWSPLYVINSITRFGIYSTSFLQSWVTSLSRYHTSIIASVSFVLVVQSFFKSRVFALLHKFSIRFREGEFPGQSRTLMRFFSKFFSLFLQYGRERSHAELLLRWEYQLCCPCTIK